MLRTTVRLASRHEGIYCEDDLDWAQALPDTLLHHLFAHSDLPAHASRFPTSAGITSGDGLLYHHLTSVIHCTLNEIECHAVGMLLTWNVVQEQLDIPGSTGMPVSTHLIGTKGADALVHHVIADQTIWKDGWVEWDACTLESNGT